MAVPVDMVLLSRPSEEAGPFVREAAERPEGPVDKVHRALWLGLRRRRPV